MNPPAISVIVPLYNCKPVIAGAIASLRAQTFRDFECLLVDDCSPDREGILLCERLIAGDPRFRLLHNAKNLDLGGARNTGVENARGDWLAFMDQDDRYFPDAFRLMIAAGEDYEADVVEGVTLREPVDAPLPQATAQETSPRVETVSEKALAERVAGMYLVAQDGAHLWNRLYRRNWWGDKRLDITPKGCDDAIFCAKYVWTARRLVRLSIHPTYRFSITPGSQSSLLSVRWISIMCQSFVSVWKSYSEGLLRVYPELEPIIRFQLRWVIAHWLVDKCWHQRATYLREERMEIAREIRLALHAIGLTLPVKESLRLWLFR